MKLLSGLRLKLLLLSAVPLFCMVIVSAIGIKESSEVAEWSHLIGDRNVPQLIGSYETQVYLVSTLRYFNGVFMTWDNPTKRDSFIKQAHESIKGIGDELDKLEKIEMSPQVKQLFTAFKNDSDKFENAAEALLAKIEKSSFTPEEKTALLQEFATGPVSTVKESMIKTNDDLVEGLKSRMIERSNATIDAAEKTKMALLTGLAVALLVSILLLVVFFRYIFSTLSSVQRAMTEAIQQVKLASEHLTTASQRLSESAVESAASVEESVASMEELSSMIQLNAKNSSEAAESAHEVQSEAETGGKGMDELAGRMSQIQNESNKMEEIIATIDDIAFQTNLLALNAAVEAARAGELGKGFAVVADAVRSLAQKSALSAKEIADLIRKSSGQVQSGVDMTGQSQKSFQSVVGSIRKITDLSRQIAEASSNQAAGIEQATSGLNQIDQGIQSNSATAEEVAASSEELGAQVRTFQTTIWQLNELIDGKSGRSQQSGEA
ncbi:MAG: methyl-accepting chemotaxis protein [Bdellovibrionales bacterium]|nr:methyl-accepting chemotaxis protein [Bdellovibrionales bacterium]